MCSNKFLGVLLIRMGLQQHKASGSNFSKVSIIVSIMTMKMPLDVKDRL